MSNYQYIKVQYNGIADCTYEHAEAPRVEDIPHYNEIWLQCSKNWVRNSICNELFSRGRKYATNPQGGYERSCPHMIYGPNTYRGFLTGKEYIYIPVLSAKEGNEYNQVWEGVLLQEILENHEQLLPKIIKARHNGDDKAWDMLDKFTRMKVPLQMAAYAVRQLAHIKRYEK